ncbi:MAG: NapC/NirT family cytochrome c [Chloroflexi bacterium]|jgi:hypothetical protein|nr:NapC/NirT family cytochrome c [Chloroflexota bacterium]
MSDSGAPAEDSGPLPAVPSEPTSQPAPGTAPDATAPGEAGAITVTASASAPQHRGLRGALGRTFSRAPHPPLRSRRGLFIVATLGGLFAVVMTVGGVVAVQWTETADFCGRCHTMAPELKAYVLGPHRDVTCAECHVEPGVTGWIKAKINGTRQLVEIVTGTFPRPIPVPDHGELPSTRDTCLKCHALSSIIANGGPVDLILNTRYAKDEANTPASVALVVRPNGFGSDLSESSRKGVHWHVISDVEYLKTDTQAQDIPYVEVRNEDGTTSAYIAAQAIEVPTDVRPDIDALKKDNEFRRMDCIACHNRVGHPIPGVDQTIDEGITAGAIDKDLPWVKSESSDLLAQEYASIEDANAAIDKGLTDYYAENHPLVAQTKSDEIDRAVRRLQLTYDLVATPEMRVTAATYPSNLGHQTAPGCFRCHDGAHYKVVDGAITNETIPAGCATCHTFPQIGSINSGVVIGERPETHNEALWIFDHRTAVDTTDPSTTSCGACHTKTYCENCHTTKAVQIPHDEMTFNHGQVAREVGVNTCAFCHQPAYCAQCHTDDVLPNQYPQDMSTPKPETGGGSGDDRGAAPGLTPFAGLRPLRPLTAMAAP